MQRISSYALDNRVPGLMQVKLRDLAVSEDTAHPFRPLDQDKRGAQRRRVLLSAMVVNREFNSIFRCQIRDVSDRGARLTIPESFLVPVGFWLIAISSGMAYEASLAWRRYPNAGVSLGEPIDLGEAASGMGRKLRAVWINAVS